MKLFRRNPIVLPRLTLAQRVVDKMISNALHYETETGESLVGFSIKTNGQVEPDLFVLDTIPPDESAIRQGAYFEQGDDVQGDIFNWWADNWDFYRARNNPPAKWDVPLANLGDWHKHPGTLTEPSWGDADTARQHIHDTVSGAPQLLAILATVWDRSHAEMVDPIDPTQIIDDRPQPLKIKVDEVTVVRLDCWYMSKQTRHFVQITPAVVDNLPELPAVAWHLRDQARARREVDALTAAGYIVSLEVHDADGKYPLEICVQLAKRTSSRAIIVVTAADFPASKPLLRTAPMSAIRNIPTNGDLFLGLWNASEPVPDSAYPLWTHDKTLAAFVSEVESKL